MNKIIVLSLFVLIISACPGSTNDSNNSAAANKANQNSSQVNVYNGYSKGAVVGNSQPPGTNYNSPYTAANSKPSNINRSYNSLSSSTANTVKTPR